VERLRRRLRPRRPRVFAGEHTSEHHSGYMNGAAESGRIAAEAAARLLV
jgi:monoamine oxidase